MRRQLVFYSIIGILLVAIYVGAMHHYDVVDRLERNYKIENDSLKQVNETQYKKLIDDRLTRKELRQIINELGIKDVPKPEIVVVTEYKIKEVTKSVDKIEYVNGKVEVEDYYPNIEKPFIRYSLKDSVSNFKFYPFEMAIVVSENRDGTWQVDSKVPDFISISKIEANAIRTKTERKRPFIVGAGYTHYKDVNVFEASIGVKVKNTFITGTATTDGGYGIKTFYNF